LVWFLVFNVTFNNISLLIVAVSFIGWGNQSTWRKPPTCHKLLINFITLYIYFFFFRIKGRNMQMVYCKPACILARHKQHIMDIVINYFLFKILAILFFACYIVFKTYKVVVLYSEHLKCMQVRGQWPSVGDLRIPC
jgi:hypothetical protein